MEEEMIPQLTLNPDLDAEPIVEVEKKDMLLKRKLKNLKRNKNQFFL